MGETIELDLSSHCLETELKKQYHRLVGQMIRGKAICRDDEIVLEAVKKALETFDFGTLRARHRALAGGQLSVFAALRIHDSGEMQLILNGHPVDTGDVTEPGR